MVAFKKWTLPIPAMPPPAAGHDFPGKYKIAFLSSARLNFLTKGTVI
jgi:hypothetical protein